MAVAAACATQKLVTHIQHIAIFLKLFLHDRSLLLKSRKKNAGFRDVLQTTQSRNYYLARDRKFAVLDCIWCLYSLNRAGNEENTDLWYFFKGFRSDTD